MKENIEEDIKIIEKLNIGALYLFNTNDCEKYVKAIENILSDHKRLQKQSKEQKKLIDKMKKILLKENRMCDFLESEEL